MLAQKLRPSLQFTHLRFDVDPNTTKNITTRYSQLFVRALQHVLQRRQAPPFPPQLKLSSRKCTEHARSVASPEWDSQLVVGALQHVPQRRQVAPVLLQRHALSFPGIQRRRLQALLGIGCGVPIGRLRSANIVVDTGASFWDWQSPMAAAVLYVLRPWHAVTAGTWLVPHML